MHGIKRTFQANSWNPSIWGNPNWKQYLHAFWAMMLHKCRRRLLQKFCGDILLIQTFYGNWKRQVQDNSAYRYLWHLVLCSPVSINTSVTDSVRICQSGNMYSAPLDVKVYISRMEMTQRIHFWHQNLLKKLRFFKENDKKNHFFGQKGQKILDSLQHAIFS